MHSAPQQAIGPVRQQIPNVHEDGRGRVGLRAWGDYRDRRPRLAVTEEDLETRLPAQTKKECQGAVVRVGASADVVLVGGKFGGSRRVAQEAQDGARRPAVATMGCGEEVRWGDTQANAEEGVELEGESVAQVAEGADLRLLVGRNGGRDGLLRLAVDEFAKVKRPICVTRDERSA